MLQDFWHPAAQRIQLAFQDIGEDSWEVGAGVLGIKVAGVEKDGLFEENLLQDFPDTKDLDEYKDYHTTPTSGTASTLISAALDANAHEVVNMGMPALVMEGCTPAELVWRDIHCPGYLHLV